MTTATLGDLRALPAAFLERYNRPGPRYTSYPTAPEWTEKITGADLTDHLRSRSVAAPCAPLSIYVHIPFCEHRCRFCGCNAIATGHREITAPYLDTLRMEMDLHARTLAEAGAAHRPVTQLHLGGGTPTYLGPAQLLELSASLRSRFQIAPDAEMSIEINPRVTSDDHLRALRLAGFNRLSLGIQDFHRPTQEIIERLQTVEETARLVDRARELGFESVNFDLVYGLPLQTAETFERTLDAVLDLGPDRVALYNFAYLPARLGHQRAIEPSLLPSGEVKFATLLAAHERFTASGYDAIGMDHFARAGDPLARARRERTMQRNFMGYTTQAGTDLLALGVSSISATDGLFAQNTKRLSTHRTALVRGELPVERGMTLSDEDRLRRTVITELMCHGVAVKSEIEAAHGVDFDEHFAGELTALAPMAADGLVVLRGDRVELTLLGIFFARNVAMVFDTYIRRPRATPLFSRTL
ncbi:MAG: oxygen-independent coproporphyrinogen III oxidase [Candidatus Sumerlaeia bacterium]|nr:oxygen-independent coproporphyrinogen III oxidase [Candidatus Sumerlaeia bacterium]